MIAGIFVVASATDNTTGLDHEVSLHGDTEGQMLASQIVVTTGGEPVAGAGYWAPGGLLMRLSVPLENLRT